MATCYELSDLSSYGLNGYRKGDEHFAYAPWGYGTLTYTIGPIVTASCR